MKNFLLMISLAAGFNVCAQTNERNTLMSDPNFLAFKKQHDEVLLKSSEYFGYEETLQSFFTGNKIPLETPKAKSNMSREEYRNILNAWLNENRTRLKAEHQQSIIQD